MNVSVPGKDRHVDRPEEGLETLVLVVDERPEGWDEERPHTWESVRPKQRGDWKRHGLTLARRSRRADDQVRVRLEDDRQGCFLVVTEGGPALAVDPALQALVEQ